jgi:DNA helicase-2/ATP-dependent DNA helicase PcrA
VIVSDLPQVKTFTRFLSQIDGLSIFASKDASYRGGVCLTTAELSKGLEFDSVIAADADRYPKNAAGTKLLYVAMTRAMHTLDVLYEGEAPF